MNNEAWKDIPDFVKVFLKRFTNSSRLDDWQSEAVEIMPSNVMDERARYEIISYVQVLELKGYYKRNELIKDIVESLIWLGITNLYGGFNSQYTFEFVQKTIKLMNEINISLPDFSRISSCSVNERGGWGNLIDMDEFLTIRQLPAVKTFSTTFLSQSSSPVYLL